MNTPAPIISSPDLIIESINNFRKHIFSYLWFIFGFFALSITSWAISNLVIPELIPHKLFLIGTLAVFAIFVGLLQMYLTVCILIMTARSTGGLPVSVTETLRLGIKHFFSFLWVTIIVGIAVLFGVIALILPGILFLFWFRFAANFAVLDDIRGIKSLKASFNLVHGRLIRTVFTRVAFPFFFFSVAGTFLTMLVYFVVSMLLGSPELFSSTFEPFTTTTVYATTTMLQSFLTSVVHPTINGLILALWFGSDILLWRALKNNPMPTIE